MPCGASSAYHRCLTEPWDGPASLSFTDGTLIGVVLDRNGLRPGRASSPTTAWVVRASETGLHSRRPPAVPPPAGSSPASCS